MNNIEEPTVVNNNNQMQETVSTHPAYAQISASRVQGGTHLYDSDFHHQHYLTINIRKSELHRGLSRDWHFAREELIEVAMSEAQWATFVSSPNMGSGVPCTLTRHDGKMIPNLPPPPDCSIQFRKEMLESMARMQADLKEVAEGLNEAMGKKKVEELQKKLHWISDRMTGSTGFVADQFGEHIEKTVEKAKVEIGAHATAMIQRAGLKALGVKMVPAISYQEDKA
jgi:hypothetical protein